MWRDRALKVFRLLVRFLLWALLLLILILLPTLAMLGSEGGSRWLLEQGLGMQRMLSARYQSGTLLSGLELEDVHFKTGALDVRVRHVLARWSLMQLLWGEARLHSLQAEGVDVRMTSPPSGEPARLPLLILPLRLEVGELVVTDVRVFTWQAQKPLTVVRIALAGQWRGSRLQLEQLQLAQEQLGELQLKGSLRTVGGYAIDADGSLDFLPFREQGWQPVAFRLQQEIVDLLVELSSQGPLTASAKGRVRPLLPDLPYSASLNWQAFTLPWLPAQKLASGGGELRVTGAKTGLRTTGSAILKGLHVPPGKYQWRASSDWKSAQVETLDFSGDMGRLEAKASVGWQQGLSWTLDSRFQGLNLARQWPVPEAVLPAMTGTLQSKGSTRQQGSTAEAVLKLDNGETWSLKEKGSSWLWDLQASQDVLLQWQQVKRRLPGLEATSSEQGSLDFSGSLKGYRARLTTDVATSRFPAGTWSGEISGADRHVNVESLRYAGDAGRLELGGEADIDTIISWQGALVLGDFETAWLLPAWPGRFTGHLAGHGRWGSQHREVNIEDSHLNGSLRDQPVVMDGALAVVLPPAGSANVWPKAWTPGLKLAWGDNQLMLTGGLREQGWNLATHFQLNEMTVLDPRLQGKVEGVLALEGEERQPDIRADLLAEKAGMASLHARSLQLQVNLPALGETAGTVALRAEGITSGTRDLGQLALDLNGTQAEHQLKWEVITDHALSNGLLSGHFDAQTLDWNGRMESGQFSLPELDWHLADAFALGWQKEQQQLLLAPHCWVSGEARLCNEEDLLIGPSGNVRLRLEGLQAERLASLLPQGLLASGLIKGHVTGGWEAGQPAQLVAVLSAEAGALTLARDEPLPPLVLPYEHLGLQAEAGTDKVDLRFDLASGTVGQGNIRASIHPYGEEKPVDGTVALQGLRLDVLQPFFPALSTLAGTVSANGRIEGTLQKPQYWGDVQLAQGEVGLHRLPVNMHDITARMDVRGHAAAISGTMKSGEGSATLAGDADWQGQPRLDLTLKGQRFELRQQPQLLAEIDPDLALKVIPGQVDLTGSIRVPMARLNIKQLEGGAVGLSPDVVIVNDEGELQSQTTRMVANWLINADISVRLGDDVFFHGYGVNGRLMGALRLRQQGKKGLEASGEVELDKDARYDAYGQRLLIRRGRLIFAGNLTQPGLDVEAVREVDSEVVGVRVAGRVNTPEVSFFADNGGLSQEEILSYLVLGRPLDQQGGENNLSAAAAAIKLGATGGAGLTTKIGESFGITDLAVDAEGSGDDTQVTVSGYLSPKLYLRYGVGIFTPVNTATLRYKISSKVYLEAVSSLESAIDLFYTLRF